MTDWVSGYVPREEQAGYYRQLWLEQQERSIQLGKLADRLEQKVDGILMGSPILAASYQVDELLSRPVEESASRVQHQRKEIARLHKQLMKMHQENLALRKRLEA